MAKKDREWTTTEKLVEVREKWVETMNAAMERQGHEQRLDHRSWRDQGREDLHELREPNDWKRTPASRNHQELDGL